VAGVFVAAAVTEQSRVVGGVRAAGSARKSIEPPTETSALSITPDRLAEGEPGMGDPLQTLNPSTFAVHSPADAHACWTLVISGGVGAHPRLG
jgi:hypothetical protein